MAVVVFQGNVDSMKKADLEAKVGYELNGAGAHARSYERVYNRRDWILAQLNHLNSIYNFEDVLFTGHSTGGTEASLAPVVLANRQKPKWKMHTITFGQTKPGDGYIAERIKKYTT